MKNAAQHSPRILPNPARVRSLETAAGFGWLDARLLRDGWLEALTVDDLAVYVFLCLVGDRQGVSWYRRDRIRAALEMDERVVWQALARLETLDLVTYRPFHAHASEGFRQVLTVPRRAPELLPLRVGGER